MSCDSSRKFLFENTNDLIFQGYKDIKYTQL